MKKKILILLLIFSTVWTPGCANYRELEHMAIVAGMSVDKAEGGEGYHLTFETLDMSGSRDKGATVKSQLIESDGATIFDGVRNALKRSGQKLYFSACKVLIISDELARRGIAPVLDFMNRDPEPRLTVQIFISKEKTAKEILEQKSVNNPIMSFALGKKGENKHDFLSKATYVQLYKAVHVLSSEGVSLVLPALGVVTNSNETTVSIEGDAVFSGDRLVGYLDGDESKYVAFIRDEISGGLLTVTLESGTPDTTLEISHSKTKVTPVLTGASPEIKIDVKTKAFLNEIMIPGGPITEDEIKKIEKKASEAVEAGIRQLIEKVQQKYGSDIFGFGNAVYKADPKYWDEIKAQWDDLFPKLKVAVSTEVTILNTSITKSKIKVGG